MKTLKLFNGRTQILEDFVPTNPHDIKIYCCGPTVYDVPHLGHARTYIFLDILRRILRNYLGYGVRSVMNITDLNDKILENGGIRSARQYEKAFFEAMDRLNVERPDFAPRVTDFINLSENVSNRCLIGKFAYYSPGFDTTYFSTEKYLTQFDWVFPQTEKRDNSSPEPVEMKGKWDVRDFAIWKNSKEWIDIEGKKQIGMPGWHTECATIVSFFFDDFVDIHVGGIDLQFPHHENEIALCRVYLQNKDLVRFCLYAGHLQTEGRKMSKSLKNFTTIDQVLEEGYSPLAIRYMFIKFPYDKPMTFNKDEIKKAQKSYENLMHHIQQIKLRLLEQKPKAIEKDCLSYWYDDYGMKMELSELNQVKEEIDVCLKDNLNVGKALDIFENYVKGFSHPLKQDLSYDWLLYCFKFIMWMADTCFGLIEQPLEKNNSSDELFPILKHFRTMVREVALREDMNEAPREALLKLCDTIRERMSETNYTVEDK